MKMLNFLFFTFILVIIGGFVYFSATDIAVEQESVTITIPNERFFGE